MLADKRGRTAADVDNFTAVIEASALSMAMADDEPLRQRAALLFDNLTRSPGCA